MNPGDRVHHPKLGKGTVIEVYAKGGRAGAKIDLGYMTAWFSADELGVELIDDDGLTDAGGLPSTVKPTDLPQPSTPLPADVVTARCGILALKLGQVLEEHVLGLSAGTELARKALESAVSAALRRRGQSVLVEGAWGSGKTHLLTMLSTIAHTRGMATSSIVLDGEGTTLSDPMRLMEAFLGSLRYPGEPAPCGLRERLARLRRAEGWRRLHYCGCHRIANVIEDARPDLLDDSDAVQIMEDYLTLSVSASQANHKLAQLGHRWVKFPPMKARTIKDRAERFSELIKEWTEFVSLTGAKGLVLVIDEMDVDYASTTRNPELQRRRKNLLRALGEQMRVRLPLLVAFGSAPSSGDVDVENDTVGDLTSEFGGVDLKIDAPRPDLQELIRLAERVQILYARAYPEQVPCTDPEETSRLLEEFAKQHLATINPIPRDFVRGTLERLDLVSSMPH